MRGRSYLRLYILGVENNSNCENPEAFGKNLRECWERKQAPE